MGDVEASMRALINSDMDSTPSAGQLLDMRLELKRLIGDWKAAGGGDVLMTLPSRKQPRLRIGTAVPKAEIRG